MEPVYVMLRGVTVGFVEGVTDGTHAYIVGLGNEIMYGLGNESSIPGSFMELGVGDTEVISIA